MKSFAWSWYVGGVQRENWFEVGKYSQPTHVFMVMELVSRKVNMRGSIGRMLHVDDLAVLVEGEREMQEVLQEWKEALGSMG